jgi:hypothetical protein
LQIIAVVCTIAGFIIIKAGDNESGQDKHGPLGVFILVVCIVQSFLGFARNIVSGFNPEKKTSDHDKGPR